MKIYISGAISKIPKKESDKKFNKAEKHLRKLGLTPVNPKTLDHTFNSDYGDFMRTDLQALLDCQAIFMLDNWKNSDGAKVELQVAKACGMQVIIQGEMIDSILFNCIHPTLRKNMGDVGQYFSKEMD